MTIQFILTVTTKVVGDCELFFVNDTIALIVFSFVHEYSCSLTCQLMLCMYLLSL